MNENNETNQEEIQSAVAGRLCYLCGATLDANKACTDTECPLYGIPQE